MCVCLYSDAVNVLFDDGVEYTAPFRAVRRRVSTFFTWIINSD